MSLESLALAAVSAFASHQAQKSQTNKQDSLLAQRLAYQSGKANDSTAAIQRYLSKLTPEQRAAQFKDAQDQSQGNIDAAINKTAAYEAPTATFGKSSSDFENRASSNAASSADRLKAITHAFATMAAPGIRDVNTSRDLNTAASDVGGNNQAINSVGNAYDSAITNAKPDPGWGLVGQIASGMSMASGLQGGNILGLLGKKLPTGVKPSSAGDVLSTINLG